MKRERIIKLSILVVVFVFALIGFSYLTNRGSADMTADIGNATMPTISFEMGDKKVNLLVGYAREMNAAAIRDTILTFDDKGKIKANIQKYGRQITSLKYTILTLDGQEKLREETIENVKETVELEVDRALPREQEGLLKITLKCDGQTIYYYTRIVKDNGHHVKDCVEYAQKFHQNALKKQDEDTIKKVLETSSKGDNTTLQHVNLHSDLQHVLWGDLKPEVVGEPRVSIQETRKTYTSLSIDYQVKCKGDKNKEELYVVHEFFKIRYSEKQMYVLDYERTMEEVFDTSNVVLNDKGVVLGIANENMSYKSNESGTCVAFIQAGELWSYDKKNDHFSLLFSFRDSENEDVRNFTNKYQIQIHSVDEEGNVTFTVSGYMNRGEHEGESGVVVYYYQEQQNTIREELFLSSVESAPVIMRELAQQVYYNAQEEALYFVLDGKLLKTVPKKKGQEILLEGLNKRNFVVSEDGHLVAYLKEEGKTDIEIRDLSKNTVWTLTPEADQLIVPLGFVGEDFVYGISKEEYIGVDATGEKIQAMSRLEIRDQKQNIVKVYEKQDSYIIGASISDNVIQLRQGRKDGNVYTELVGDHITNNEMANGAILLKSYWTDLKQTQYRLVFSEGIKDKKAKTMEPKQVLQERTNLLEREEKAEGYYYVYGHGQSAGAFKDLKAAITLAENLSGVVISSRQNYIWETDNRSAWYRNFKIDKFSARDGESSFEACVRRVLSYEGTVLNIEPGLDVKGAEKLLSEKLQAEVIRFQGCSVKDVFYLMDKGVAVIAMKNSRGAVLLLGYDAKTVTYADPTNGAISTVTIEKANEMLSESGQTLIGYIR